MYNKLTLLCRHNNSRFCFALMRVVTGNDGGAGVSLGLLLWYVLLQKYPFQPSIQEFIDIRRFNYPWSGPTIHLKAHKYKHKETKRYE